MVNRVSIVCMFRNVLIFRPESCSGAGYASWILVHTDYLLKLSFAFEKMIAETLPRQFFYFDVEVGYS